MKVKVKVKVSVRIGEQLEYRDDLQQMHFFSAFEVRLQQQLCLNDKLRLFVSKLRAR